MQDSHQDWSEEDGELTSLLLGARHSGSVSAAA